MMLTRHTQVENLTNLLHVRRSAAVRQASVQQAYMNLVAAVLDVPVSDLGEPTLPAVRELTPMREASRQAA